MKQGICKLSNIPVRKEPSGTSEMVNMLLFGEQYEIIEKQNEWLNIIGLYDGYSGWINIKQHTELFGECGNSHIISNFPFVKASINNTTHFLLPGSEIFNFNGNVAEIDTETITLNDSISIDKQTIVETALQYINAPYLWGGRSPFGIDCSGFTQVVFKIHGIKLKRDAYQQAEQGETVAFREIALPGDLAFFDNTEGKITHTGIMLDADRIIHASGQVRIDRIDQYGIIHSESGEYSHKLRIIKRIDKNIV